MNVFYSILYTSIRPIAKEQLSIGLFVSDSQRTFFHFSSEKLNLTRRLLSDNSFHLLKGYLEGLRKDIEKRGEAKGFTNISPEYFNYLSNYSNNLISFSKPTQINIELDQIIFEKLFEKFVFSYEKALPDQILKKNPLDYIKKHLYPKIESRVNLNQVLTPKEIPSLIIPKVKVNFIGQNNRPVAGDALNFEASSYTLSNQISHFISLIKAFELEQKVGKYFILGEEPSKRDFPEQHSTWKHITDSGLIEFVPSNEIETVSDYMNKHNVRPFVED